MGDIVSPLLNLVPFLLGQLEKEFNIPAEAEEKFQRLKDSIGVIERFLKKANSMEVITEDLKVSVKRARKFLYVCEDAIDDFTRPPDRRNFEWERFILALYHHCKRRNFNSEAGHILQMVDDYITVESGDIMKALSGSSGNEAQSSSAGHLSSSIAYSEESDEFLVGIDQSKKDLVELLKDDSRRPKVIFVHGPRGVGKTSLVGAVLRDKEVELLFKYYVWIEDLGSCELSAAALMEANTKMWDLSSAEKENPQDHKLKEAFRYMEKDNELNTKQKRWALVMDDASRVDVFQALESDLNRTCPIVLVTTRVRSLQSSSKRFFKSKEDRNVSHEFECVLLTKNDSELLFQKNIRQENIHGDVSKCILENFNGLPHEILATCDLLNRRRPSATGAPDRVKWKKLSGRLGDALLSNGYQGGPIRRMRAPRMDPFLDVRAYLFYLSVFPLEHPIRCSTMMQLWIAEGFIKQNDTQPVQEKAEETLERLLDHYEILVKEKTSYGRIKTCGLPPIWHQQIISESVDEEFAMIVDRPERQWPENVWHLSFHGDLKSPCDDRWVKQLRSLLVFKKVHLDSLNKTLKNAKRIKVLDLQSHLTEQEKNDHGLLSFPEEILNLRYLRYLNLRGSRIKDISNDINNLKFLETLDLRETLVRALPELTLKALHHLLISNGELVKNAPVGRVPLKLKIIRIRRSCVESLRRPLTHTNPMLGVEAPSKLGDLTSLQKLCMIKSAGEEKWLKEVGELINLQKLGLSELKSEDWKPLWSSIAKLTNLEALHLIGAKEQIIKLPMSSEWKAPESLQRVHLTGQLETLPEIFPHDSLVKLVLKGSLLKEDPLPHLRKFSRLKHLELEEAYDFNQMDFCEGQFEKLCFLGLSNFSNLVSITVEGKALPSLERLYIARCKLLKSVPQFITTERLRKFIHLEFCEMNTEFDNLASHVKYPEDMTAELLTWNVATQVVDRVRGINERPTFSDFLELPPDGSSC